jgi:hypothetical protein
VCKLARANPGFFKKSFTELSLKERPRRDVTLPTITQSQAILSSQYLVFRFERIDPDPDGCETKVWQAVKKIKAQ